MPRYAALIYGTESDATSPEEWGRDHGRVQPLRRGRRRRRRDRRRRGPAGDQDRHHRARRPAAPRAATSSSPTARSPRPRKSSAASTCSTARTSTRRSGGPSRSPAPGTGGSRSGPASTSAARGLSLSLDEVIRIEGGQVLATLIRLTGDIDAAEDALQDAVLVATEVWAPRRAPRQAGRLAHHGRQEQGAGPDPARGPARRQGGRGGAPAHRRRPRRPATTGSGCSSPAATRRWRPSRRSPWRCARCAG